MNAELALKQEDIRDAVSDWVRAHGWIIPEGKGVRLDRPRCSSCEGIGAKESR